VRDDEQISIQQWPFDGLSKTALPGLEELRDREFQELFALLKTSTRILKDSLHPQGFNIGMNIGKAGGAGEDHLHIHIVPRWTGDTNFMPVIGETKVVPEYLEKTYQKLHSASPLCCYSRPSGL
jgi:ATP adenylyltransferase